MTRKRQWHRLTLYSLLLGVIATPAKAQQDLFADDFSSNTIKYSTDYYTVEPDRVLIEQQNQGLIFTAESDGSNPAEAILNVLDQSSSLIITTQADVSVSTLDDDAWTQITVAGTVFNDVPDTSASDNPSLGDINMSLGSAIFSDGSTNMYVCVSREGENGYEEYPFFEDGNHCKDYPASAPELGSEFTMGFAVGTDNVITLTMGDQTATLNFPDTLSVPSQPRRSVGHAVSNGAGNATYIVKTIQTDSGVDDFTVSTPVVDRYDIGLPDGSVPRIENGRVLVTSGSPADRGNSTRLNSNTVTDYFETTVEISSQTSIDNPGSDAYAGIFLHSLNDTADGGFDGRTGDIRALVFLNTRYNGLRRAEYCLYRFEDADSENRTGLLDGGNERCREFPVRVEFDTPYRLAIDFDRSVPSVTFRVNGFSYTETLGFNTYTAAQPVANVEMGAARGGNIVGYIDDIRNSKVTLTATETSSGATAPASFPDAPTQASLAVDSTIDSPFDFNKPATFIDDFSSDTTWLGIDNWDDANIGFSYADGALELQANATRDPNDGGGAAVFKITRPSDSIMVRGAVSSDSRIPAGNNSGAVLEIQATFHNDTIDGGYDEQGGDVEATLRLQFQGNGRARVETELGRRDESGNRDRLSVFPDGEDGYDFNGFLPRFDVTYNLGIRIDREQRLMIYTLDDQEISVPLESELFIPARRDIEVVVSHRGQSGRADVKLYSIATDNESIDFTAEAPVVAPYRPTYESQNPASSVTIVDGRARLATDGRVSNSSRNAQIRLRGVSDYVGADIELSSESVVSDTGFAFVGVSGSLYSELDNGSENAEGRVFTAIRLQSSGEEGRYVEYCAWRSMDESFTDTIELIGGDPGNCPRFTFVPELDTTYPASISLDKTAMTLTFKFAAETYVHTITSDIFIEGNQFNGVRSRTSEDSSVVAFADNLAFSDTPTALALSDENFGFETVTQSPTDTPTGNPAEDTGSIDGGNDVNNDGNSDGSSSGSSGGCSIGSSGGNTLFPLLVLCALIGLQRRRRRLHA